MEPDFELQYAVQIPTMEKENCIGSNFIPYDGIKTHALPPKPVAFPGFGHIL